MWCARCEQNVAVEFAVGQRSARCALCQHPLAGLLRPVATERQRTDESSDLKRADRGRHRFDAATVEFVAEPPCWDEWQLEDALARARWADRGSSDRRVDTAPAEEPTVADVAPAGGWFWLVACLGLASVVFGGVMLGWSLLGRADLFHPGLLAVLAGQLLLVLGVAGYFGSRKRGPAAVSVDSTSDREILRPPLWPTNFRDVLYAPVPEGPPGRQS